MYVRPQGERRPASNCVQDFITHQLFFIIVDLFCQLCWTFQITGTCLNLTPDSIQINFGKQAGAELGQAQFKLRLAMPATKPKS